VKKRKKILPSISAQIKADYLKTINSKSNLICTAPFTGLYFTPDGTVKPCCTLLNNFKFGTYPSDSIKEILKSENRKTLQKYIKKDSLEFGCQNCLKNIEIGNYKGSISSIYQKYKHGRYPKVIDFELSHFCNLDCEMCFLHTSVQQESNIYNSVFLREIKPYLKKLESAKFYGGEPFLIKIYRDIWDIIIAENPKCNVHIQTNATIFDEYVKSLLHKADVFIGVSLDAMNPELYEEIRRGAKFENVKKNILSFNEIMKSQGKSLLISFCPMPKNWQELIPVVLFAESINAKVFFNTVNFPSTYNLNYLPSSELIKIKENIVADFTTHNMDINKNKNEISNFIDGLNKIIEKQIEIEKEYTWLSLSEFNELLYKLINKKALVKELIELLTLSGFKEKFSPYIIAEICTSDINSLETLVESIVKNQDIDYVRKLLVINK